MSDIRIGPSHLDDCRFEWPLYRGAHPRKPLLIRQSAEMLAELLALPRVTFLEFEASAEDGTSDPVTEILRIEGVRVLHIDTLADGRTCEVALGTCRDDIARRISDTDVNLLYKDGYLQLTEFDRISDWLTYVMQRIPELADSAAPDWSLHAQAAPLLPDRLPMAGPYLTHAIDALCDFSGLSFTLTKPGLWKLIPRDAAVVDIVVDAYSWVEGLEPSWTIASRVSRDLPKYVRFHYPELHAIRLSYSAPFGATAASSSNALDVGLLQVYQTDDGFKTLPELLVSLGYAANAIDEEAIARVVNTRNWQGTALERGVTRNAERAISIIKRDFRLLYKIDYPAAGGIGRSGGWTGWQWGRFQERPDKDGVLRFTAQLSAEAVRCEHTEYLSQAEYPWGGTASSAIATVARSRLLGSNGELPAAPFTVQWVSEADEVLRIVPNVRDGEAQAVWPGRMTDTVADVSGTVKARPKDNAGNTILTTEVRQWFRDEDGNLVQLDHEELHVPTPEDVRFSRQFELEIYAVAARRLPNTFEKWTRVDVPFIADGEVEVTEIEVGHELYALRDFVKIAAGGVHTAEADGLGRWLNLPELEQDAQDRAKVLRDRLALTRAGSGTAQGVSLALDHDVHGAVTEMAVEVDYPVILTRVEVGEFSTEQSQLERRRRNEAMRGIKHGGFVAT